MKEVSISFNPSKEQFTEIESWLREEDHRLGQGFFCNIDPIIDSYRKKKIGIISLKKNVIGFITWFDHERIIEIQIAEIKPEFRKMGYGRILVEALLKKFQKQEVKATYLYCQPADSEYIWKKMRFIQFPESDGFKEYNSIKGKHLYKILTQVAIPIKSKLGNESIELWTVEPDQSSNLLPEFVWYPKFKQGTRNLIKPIIFPSTRDWNIRWIKDDNILYTGKVKYFKNKEINLIIEIDFVNFIIIEELPIIKS